MYTILEKRVLAENIYLMRVHAPRVARAAKPGQFIIVRIDEFGERVPLTISDYDAEQGSVTIVTQAIGASTRKTSVPWSRAMRWPISSVRWGTPRSSFMKISTPCARNASCS